MTRTEPCRHPEDAIRLDHYKDIVWTLCVACGLEGWPVLRDRVPPRPGTEKTEPGSGRTAKPLCKTIVTAEPMWEEGVIVATLYRRCSLRDGHDSGRFPHRYIEGIGDYFSDSAV